MPFAFRAKGRRQRGNFLGNEGLLALGKGVPSASTPAQYKAHCLAASLSRRRSIAPECHSRASGSVPRRTGVRPPRAARGWPEGNGAARAKGGSRAYKHRSLGRRLIGPLKLSE